MKILIIDDHQLFLDGLVHLLANFEPVLDISVATSTTDALKKFSPNSYDLVLLDLNMPGLDGISCLGGLQKIQSDVPVVIISAMEDSDNVVEALRLGSIGFIPKSFGQEQLFNALKRLFQGDIFIPEEVQWHLSHKIETDLDSSLNLKLAALNIREKQFGVLKLVAEGLTVQKISDSLCVSPNTVKSHIKKLYISLNANSRVTVVSEARKLGLLD